jgi:NarL family two-component system sensor histidine kinase LiaS
MRRSIDEINRVIRDLRGYIYGLTPSLLYESDLHAALLKLAEDFTAKVRITVAASVDPGVAQILAPHSVQLIQFATEALSNVARHSASARCSLTLRREGDLAVLQISDNGVGFDPEQESHIGFGLHSLRERATQVGGRLTIDSVVGQGTSLRLEIPLTKVAAQTEPGSRV